jgi:hypothetical protein
MDEQFKDVVDHRKNDSQPDNFDAELEVLLFYGPSLPFDFSRADIYALTDTDAIPD